MGKSLLIELIRRTKAAKRAPSKMPRRPSERKLRELDRIAQEEQEVLERRAEVKRQERLNEIRGETTPEVLESQKELRKETLKPQQNRPYKDEFERSKYRDAQVEEKLSGNKYKKGEMAGRERYASPHPDDPQLKDKYKQLAIDENEYEGYIPPEYSGQQRLRVPDETQYKEIKNRTTEQERAKNRVAVGRDELDDANIRADERAFTETGIDAAPESVMRNPDIDLTGKPLEQALYEMMMDTKFPGQVGHNLGPVTPPDLPSSKWERLQELRNTRDFMEQWGRSHTAERMAARDAKKEPSIAESLFRRKVKDPEVFRRPKVDPNEIIDLGTSQYQGGKRLGDESNPIIEEMMRRIEEMRKAQSPVHPGYWFRRSEE